MSIEFINLITICEQSCFCVEKLDSKRQNRKTSLYWKSFWKEFRYQASGKVNINFNA